PCQDPRADGAADLPAHVRRAVGSGNVEHQGGVLMRGRRRTSRARCLVVEDDPFACELVAEPLDLAGFEVTATGDGREALDMMLADPPDLCVLDIDLHGLDGISILQQLRANRVATGVIMLTGRADELDRVR